MKGTRDLYPPRDYVELMNIKVGIDLTQNEALRKKRNVTSDNFPDPKSKKINEGDGHELNEKAVKRRRYSSNSTNVHQQNIDHLLIHPFSAYTYRTPAVVRGTDPVNSNYFELADFSFLG